MRPLIEIKNLSLDYPLIGGGEFRALNRINLNVYPGEFVAIMGPSGSGKSTLANVIGLLQMQYQGHYRLSGYDIAGNSDDRNSELRSSFLGFIFQDYILLDHLTAIENVMLPLSYASISERKKRKRARQLMESLGISRHESSFPKKMSGGEKQRIAIARALIKEPKLILADEPTGALDRKSRYDVLELLQSIAARGTTIVMVTHSDEDARAASRVVRVSDGSIVADDQQTKVHRFYEGGFEKDYPSVVNYFANAVAGMPISLLEYLEANIAGVFDATTFDYILAGVHSEEALNASVRSLIVRLWPKFSRESKVKFTIRFFELGLEVVSTYRPQIVDTLTRCNQTEFEGLFQRLTEIEVFISSAFFDPSAAQSHISPKVRSLLLRAIKKWGLLARYEPIIRKLVKDADPRVRTDALEAYLGHGLNYSTFLKMTNADALSSRELRLKIQLLSQDSEKRSDLSVEVDRIIKTEDMAAIKACFFALSQVEPDFLSEKLNALFNLRPEFFRYREEIVAVIDQGKQFPTA